MCGVRAAGRRSPVVDVYALGPRGDRLPLHASGCLVRPTRSGGHPVRRRLVRDGAALATPAEGVPGRAFLVCADRRRGRGRSLRRGCHEQSESILRRDPETARDADRAPAVPGTVVALRRRPDELAWGTRRAGPGLVGGRDSGCPRGRRCDRRGRVPRRGPRSHAWGLGVHRDLGHGAPARLRAHPGAARPPGRPTRQPDAGASGPRDRGPAARRPRCRPGRRTGRRGPSRPGDDDPHPAREGAEDGAAQAPGVPSGGGRRGWPRGRTPGARGVERGRRLRDEGAYRPGEARATKPWIGRRRVGCHRIGRHRIGNAGVDRAGISRTGSGDGRRPGRCHDASVEVAWRSTAASYRAAVPTGRAHAVRHRGLVRRADPRAGDRHAGAADRRGGGPRCPGPGGPPRCRPQPPGHRVAPPGGVRDAAVLGYTGSLGTFPEIWQAAPSPWQRLEHGLLVEVLSGARGRRRSC